MATSVGRVLLLHGLMRTNRSMIPMERAFRSKGYEVVNLGYPSRRGTIAEHAARVRHAVGALGGTTPWDCVAHSLGGIIIRHLLAQDDSPLHIRRLVMIGPPNQGALVARCLAGYSPFRFIFGPPLTEVSTIRMPRMPRETEVGIVRGSFPSFFPGLIADSDGIVARAEAVLPEAKEYFDIPGPHALLMRDPRVIAASLRFIQQGCF